ncbi:hypothetical protein D1Y85_15555 [Paraburkholderia dinghuensis]|uniref:Copper chaperone PCu(A)C n=1 Tax=Paraburkholderia dinghuensis TaxID=2305225 RepID=A0A3N6MPG0_9BURK|nr:hypothetical protein D1Y85_15555 [Paraburkholderia dinghuensis]
MAVLAGQPAAAQQAGAGEAAARTSPYVPVTMPRQARELYDASRGVDSLSVRRTASGNLLRFSFRVTDRTVAKMIGDKSATPYLFGHMSHAVLEVPVMENIGQLRQTGELEVGREYWMVFSNKGNLVKAGERVDVFIGSFHVDGLVVE